MSLNVQQITLDLEKHKFLGISIVGQNNESGDGGIYIGSIMKGGAVAADGRIEAGDMLLQGIGFIIMKHFSARTKVQYFFIGVYDLYKSQ